VIDVNGLLNQLDKSINQGRFEEIIGLLYRIPQTLNDVLNEEYLDLLINRIKGLDTGLLQIKLLSMIRERADVSRKIEIRKMLLEKIIYISRKIAGATRGVTRTITAPYRAGLDEIDADKTLEEQMGNTGLDYRNIYCLEKVKQKSSYVLMLDVSNSMHREKVAVATIATGVFAHKLKNDFHAVITFSRGVNVIKNIFEPNIVTKLVDKMLDIETGGSTNIKKALASGIELLKRSKTLFKTGILVTDGWATTGGDPVEMASKFDRLHVLGISFGLGGCDPLTNAQMAKRGRGRYHHIARFDDLPAAINRVLTAR